MQRQLPGKQFVMPGTASSQDKTHNWAAEESVGSGVLAAAALPPAAQGESGTESGGRHGGHPSGTWGRSAGAGTMTAGSCGRREVACVRARDSCCNHPPQHVYAQPHAVPLLAVSESTAIQVSVFIWGGLFSFYPTLHHRSSGWCTGALAYSVHTNTK